MNALGKNVHILLLAGIALCLLQIWLPGYYLTGDGPCHVYNAQIMHDMWCNKHSALYDRFYTLVYRPDPNWLSTFVMALLLFMFKGVLVEKIFLSLYVLLYITGFYSLIRKIGKISSYWLLVIFIFVFPLTLAKGFYNFSFSIAFYFWMVWAWLRFLDKKGLAPASLFFMFAALTFFTHLLPFAFGAFTCGALVTSYALARPQDHALSPAPRTGAFFTQYIGWLSLLLLPFLILMIWFTQKEGGLRIHLAPHPYRLLELVQFKYIITLTGAEKLPSCIAGAALCMLGALAIVGLRNGFKVHKYDGFVLALLFVAFVYLFFPEDFMGRAIIISIRTQLFVFILLVCCISYRMPEGNIKYAGAFVLFLCFSWLSIVRINCMSKVSAALDDYLFVGNLIKPGSTVLPLNFSLEGLDSNGRMIADRNSVFHHAAGYLGLEQPIILFNNYEANIGYFPVQWRPDVNPYNNLSRFQGIEAVPPAADIGAYKRQSGVTVDYVIMWCYQPSFLQNEYFANLDKEINKDYHLVYRSSSQRVLLYQKN